MLMCCFGIAHADEKSSVSGAARRVALVIGNGSYADAPLRNPVNDARAMAAALRELGFEVIARENADLPQLENAVREFGRRLERAHTGLFYFAGHGMQIKGRNYLVPINARIEHEDEVAYRSLDAGLVLDKMDSAKTQVNLMILDACRNNPFHRLFRARRQGLAEMEAPAGTLIAFATAPGAVALDGAGNHGVYTQHLLQEMRQRGQPVEQVFKRVRIGVAKETRDQQIPWESSSLREDFQFLAASATPTVNDTAIDLEFWDSIKNGNRAADFVAYLEQFPKGRFAALARIRLNELQAPNKPPTPTPPAAPAVNPAPAPAPMPPATPTAASAPRYQSISYDSEGQWLAAGMSDGRIQLFSGGIPRQTLQTGASLTALRLSADGQRLASGNAQGEVALLDRPSGKTIWRQRVASNALRQLVFSPDGRYLLTGTAQGEVILSRTLDGSVVQKYNFGDALHDLHYAPDGRYLAGVTGQGVQTRVRVVEVGSGRELLSLAASAASFSVNGRYLLVAAGGDTPTLFDIASGKELRRFARYNNRIVAGAYAESGTHVATIDASGHAQLLETAAGKPVASVQTITGGIAAYSFNADARLLAVIDRDGRLTTHRLQESP